MRVPKGKKGSFEISASDENMLRSFYICFDRPAFKKNFEAHTDLHALMAALDDTIAAISTGVKKRRDGIVFGDPVEGKSYFQSPDLREAFDEIVGSLSEAKALYAQARNAGYFFDLGTIGRSGLAFHAGRQDEAIRVAVMIDQLRNRALEIANEIYGKLGMAPFPYILTPEHYQKLACLPSSKNARVKDSKSKFMSLIDVLELKPNFFGMGINVNELLKKVQRRH